MISNRLNKFSIRSILWNCIDFSRYDIDFWSEGTKKLKAAENTSTENANQDEASASDNKEVVSETENNSTQKNDLTNQLRKKQILIHTQEAKEAPTTSSTQQQQNNATTSTETKPQNIEKKMLNLQL